MIITTRYRDIPWEEYSGTTHLLTPNVPDFFPAIYGHFKLHWIAGERGFTRRSNPRPVSANLSLLFNGEALEVSQYHFNEVDAEVRNAFDLVLLAIWNGRTGSPISAGEKICFDAAFCAANLEPLSLRIAEFISKRRPYMRFRFRHCRSLLCHLALPFRGERFKSSEQKRGDRSFIVRAEQLIFFRQAGMGNDDGEVCSIFLDVDAFAVTIQPRAAFKHIVHFGCHELLRFVERVGVERAVAAVLAQMLILSRATMRLLALFARFAFRLRQRVMAVPVVVYRVGHVGYVALTVCANPSTCCVFCDLSAAQVFHVRLLCFDHGTTIYVYIRACIVRQVLF